MESKKLNISVALFAIWFSLSWFSLPAQLPDSELRFENPRQKMVSLRFNLINNLTIIPVIINDSDTLHFILDTGLNTSILTEMSMTDSLSLQYTRRVKLSGLGEGEPVDALHSTGNHFRIPGISGYNHDLFVLLQNIFNLSNILGIKVHGLMGYHVFRSLIVEISFQRKQITFHQPDLYQYKPGKRSFTMPLDIQNAKSYITASIVQGDGSVVPVKMLVDLGASHALWLDPGSDERIILPDKTIETFLGTGLRGQIHGEIGKIGKLVLGPYELKEPVVAYPDSLSVGMASRLDNRNGSIGADVLRRFDIIIDYPNKRLTLTPNRHFREAFKINMSGIEIESLIPGLPYYQVSYVRKNSPADRAGIRRGDDIVSVNNQPAFGLTINAIYDIFESRPGRKVKMVVRRKGHKLNTLFYLEDLL